MNAISPICLTDLAPALRWHRPSELGPFLRHSRLVDGWWRSVPLPRVLDIAGTAWLAHSLALLAAEYWEHLPTGEFQPPQIRRPSCWKKLKILLDPASHARVV